MKHTALYEEHEALGARMIPFGGYTLPGWYSHASAEHMAVRESAGMFDIAHMGFVAIRGDAVHNAALLQKIVTNDIAKTQPNSIMYTFLLNESGGILDDVMVGYNPLESAYYMIINAANKSKIMAWLEAHGLTRLDPQFDSHSLIAIQGPQAIAAATPVIHTDWSALNRFTGQACRYANQEGFVMRSGYTGEDGIEVLFPNAVVPALWRDLQAQGIRPCGLLARDSLRIEAGLPLYGHELSETINPRHTRYPWVLKWGTGFMGESALNNTPVTQHTVGLRFTDRCLPRQGDAIREGGVITSGTLSPVLQVPIAMAMVPLTISIGQSVTVAIRGRHIPATVVKLPFILR
jgi:aminomethyltransferase